jgi:hypothetical protein
MTSAVATCTEDIRQIPKIQFVKDENPVKTQVSAITEGLLRKSVLQISCFLFKNTEIRLTLNDRGGFF